jgi:hypothetical protein
LNLQQGATPQLIVIIRRQTQWLVSGEDMVDDRDKRKTQVAFLSGDARLSHVLSAIVRFATESGVLLFSDRAWAIPSRLGKLRLVG